MKLNKQQKKNLIIAGFVLLAVFTLMYFKSDATLSVAYSYQCSLPSCSYGYTLTDKYCEGLTCYGICEKPVPAYCGDYGTWRLKESTSQWDGDIDRGDYFQSPKLYMSSDKCYIAKAEARFIPTDMGSANSFNLYVAGAGSSDSQCTIGLHTTTLGLPEKTYGHSTTTSTFTSAQVNDFGYSGCSGGEPWLSNMKGLLTTTIKYREAEWIDDEVITQKVDCSFECSSDSDCGSTGYVGSPYCSSNNVVQNYQSNVCSNYKCSSSQNEQVLEFCDYGCEAGQCVQRNLVTFYRLENNLCTPLQIYEDDKRYNDYTSLSECQKHIEEENILVYSLDNNCNSAYIKISQKTDNDYLTRTECINQINQKIKYYRLTDNQCNEILIYSSEKTNNDYSSLQECNDAKVGGGESSESYLLEIILGGLTLLLGLVVLIVWLIRKK